MERCSGARDAEGDLTETPCRVGASNKWMKQSKFVAWVHYYHFVLTEAMPLLTAVGPSNRKHFPRMVLDMVAFPTAKQSREQDLIPFQRSASSC